MNDLRQALGRPASALTTGAAPGARGSALSASATRPPTMVRRPQGHARAGPATARHRERPVHLRRQHRGADGTGRGHQGVHRAEVLPHVPDAWVDHAKTKVGYEIPFTRHFYKYVPPRPLEEIDADLNAARRRDPGPAPRGRGVSATSCDSAIPMSGGARVTPIRHDASDQSGCPPVTSRSRERPTQRADARRTRDGVLVGCESRRACTVHDVRARLDVGRRVSVQSVVEGLHCAGQRACGTDDLGCASAIIDRYRRSTDVDVASATTCMLSSRSIHGQSQPTCNASRCRTSTRRRMPPRVPVPPTATSSARSRTYLDRETAQIDTLIAKQEQLIATAARAPQCGAQTRRDASRSAARPSATAVPRSHPDVNGDDAGEDGALRLVGRLRRQFRSLADGQTSPDDSENARRATCSSVRG